MLSHGFLRSENTRHRQVSRRLGDGLFKLPIRIFNHYIQLPVLILGLIEAAILVIAVYAGAYLRFSGGLAEITQSIGPLFPRGLVFAAVMMLSMVAMGLYHARLQPRRTGMLLRVAVGFVLSGAVMTALFYLFPYLYLGRGALALTVLFSFVLIAVVRLLFYAVVDDDLFKRRVLVFGAGEKAASVLNMRRRADVRGFKLVGFVSSPSEAVKVPGDLLVDVNEPLYQFAAANAVDEIVVAIDDRRRGLPVQGLLDCKLGGIMVSDALTFFERETGTVKLDLLYPSWMIFSEGFGGVSSTQVPSRIFDILASLALLVITWPAMLVTALAIKIEDGAGAPVFYRQKRVGFKGALFDVLKFRSMGVDAEKDGQAKWAEVNDVRVTRVGSVIRKYRIDELPQIFNVLRGDMCFVGPRPERPDFVDELSADIPYYRERHCVKPGITGWAQLCYQYGSSRKDALEKLQYDLYYVKNRSLLFDLMILLQTAEVVLWKTGAR